MKPKTRSGKSSDSVKRAGSEKSRGTVKNRVNAKAGALKKKTTTTTAQPVGSAAKASSAGFSFMKLPPELRCMVYKYLLVSKEEDGIDLAGTRTYTKDGIQTAILVACKDIYQEASEVLYTQNKVIALFHSLQSGFELRVDDETDKFKKMGLSSLRPLRNGRVVDKVKHKGVIYPHILHRLRHVNFRVLIFAGMRGGDMCYAFCMNRLLDCALNFLKYLKPLYQLMCTRWDMLQRDIRFSHKQDWKITIKDHGNYLSTALLQKSIEPLLTEPILHAVAAGKLKMEVIGHFQYGAGGMFKRFFGLKGFDPSKAFENTVKDLYWDSGDFYESYAQYRARDKYWLPLEGAEATQGQGA